MRMVRALALIRHISAIPRHDAPELCKKRRPRKKRAQGMPGAAAPEASRANVSEAHERSHHRFRRINRHSPRNGFNGLFRALPGERIRLVTVVGGLRLIKPGRT